MRVHSHIHDAAQGWTDLDRSSGSDLVVVFGPTRLLERSDPVSEIREAFPDAVVVGCSTAGEIVGREVRDTSAVAGTVAFDGTHVRHAVAPISPASSWDAGAAIADVLHDEALQAVFVLSDGLAVNGSELVRGLVGGVGEDVVVTGGLAADGDRFEKTWVLADGKPCQGMVSAVGLYGDRVRVGHGSKGGWDVFGPERVVTRADGNVVYEIDGRPALSLYKEYLGELATGLPATGLLFPLSVRQPHTETSLVRTILAVDEADQSLVFAGDVPTGHLATLMQANFDRLVEGAEDAARLTATPHNAGDVLSIAISCVGRRLVLSARVEEEIEATFDVLPPHTTQIGFYSYGEISPHAAGGCELHNQTMTLTTIAELV